jgi:hypothetical protein
MRANLERRRALFGTAMWRSSLLGMTVNAILYVPLGPRWGEATERPGRTRRSSGVGAAEST